MLPKDESQVKPEETTEEKPKETKKVVEPLTPEQKEKLWEKYGYQCVGHPGYADYVRSQVIAEK